MIFIFDWFNFYLISQDEFDDKFEKYEDGFAYCIWYIDLYLLQPEPLEKASVSTITILIMALTRHRVLL